MKRILVLIICVFALTAFTPGSRTARNSPRSYFAPVPEGNVQDPPQQVEWDPKEQGIGDLTEMSRTENTLPVGKDIPIIGERFSPRDFASYVKKTVLPDLQTTGFRPRFIVLHHTGIPSISQRPNGFTKDNMQGLAHYYGFKQRWRSGPHLFVDQNGIWVFSKLSKVGTHSPSWNSHSWGIEQLGNFSLENYEDGAGAKIRDNAIDAVAILSIAKGLNVDTLHFHKEDPNTSHKWCPGSSCKKAGVIASVKRKMDEWRATWNSL